MRMIISANIIILLFLMKRNSIFLPRIVALSQYSAVGIREFNQKSSPVVPTSHLGSVVCRRCCNHIIVLQDRRYGNVPDYIRLFKNENDGTRQNTSEESDREEQNTSADSNLDEPKQGAEAEAQLEERPSSRIETYDERARFRDSSRPPDSHYPPGPLYRRSHATGSCLESLTIALSAIAPGMHVSPHTPSVSREIMFASLFCFTALALTGTESFCGDNVRWSHRLSIVNAYGVWHGVGFAQHTPDMTNKPIEVGCVTLYISDATGDYQYDWLDWAAKPRYNNSDWIPATNPWSSWLAARRKRHVLQERRIRVLWDEDGQTIEQTYDYSPEEPGLWTTEQWRPGEREMRARGIDLWYPDDPPRHPEVIRVLKLTPDEMIINHCTDLGDGGMFSLILARSPARVGRWERLEWLKLLLSYGLAYPHRYIAVCDACAPMTSLLCLLATEIILRLL